MAIIVYRYTDTPCGDAVGTLVIRSGTREVSGRMILGYVGKTFTWTVPKLAKDASASLTSPSFEVHMRDVRFRLWPKGVDGSAGRATVFVEFCKRDTADASTSVLLRSCVLTAKCTSKKSISTAPTSAEVSTPTTSIALIDPSVGDSHWHPVSHFTVSFNSWSCDAVTLFIPDLATSQTIVALEPVGSGPVAATRQYMQLTTVRHSTYFKQYHSYTYVTS